MSCSKFYGVQLFVWIEFAVWNTVGNWEVGKIYRNSSKVASII